MCNFGRDFREGSWITIPGWEWGWGCGGCPCVWCWPWWCGWLPLACGSAMLTTLPCSSISLLRPIIPRWCGCFISISFSFTTTGSWIWPFVRCFFLALLSQFRNDAIVCSDLKTSNLILLPNFHTHHPFIVIVLVFRRSQDEYKLTYK